MDILSIDLFNYSKILERHGQKVCTTRIFSIAFYMNNVILPPSDQFRIAPSIIPTPCDLGLPCGSQYVKDPGAGAQGQAAYPSKEADLFQDVRSRSCKNPKFLAKLCSFKCHDPSKSQQLRNMKNEIVDLVVNRITKHRVGLDLKAYTIWTCNLIKRDQLRIMDLESTESWAWAANLDELEAFVSEVDVLSKHICSVEVDNMITRPKYI
ncbi:uncharacterized protein BDR25DRAFT_352173 [Lindgomyces ingoldianus]|uniref:Uncharacterized protein n=1 Tax=Lindgomyces ingoldianus TaxID=673940 RepID=A0ACB6R3K2_9PLEO|nr:uncharacterized protein BDR25DRAFT_352173 [Lindgomyces ingoldianus]KAF2473685.1 hypothetical protein BDR25DRAFT_352173 [Lindgomyces ingoldianus]